MKKFYYSLFAAASMMLAVTSCSQEEDFVQSSSEMTTFSVSLDESAGSRATDDPVIGDGTKVNQLHYVVYNSESSTVVIEKDVKTFSNKTVQLELPLMKSEKYDILFWAQASSASDIYTTTDLRAIKINYNYAANREDADAFFNALDGFTADGGKHKVVLRRPFAQLNVATTVEDWTEATEKYNKNNGTTGKNPVTKSKVTVSQLASKFDVLTGTASEPTTTEVIFTADKIEELLKDENNLSITKEGASTSYKLLAMNYLLALASQGPDGLNEHTPVGEDAKDVVEVEFTLYKGENGDQEIASVKVPSTPIQRNYRTNIIGDLLTGEDFDIIIDNIFDDYNNEYIDIKADGIVKKDGKYYITNKNGLEAFANLVNYGSSQTGRAASTGYNFAGMTFVLDCDIDLAGAKWTPIGSYGAKFSGTFDGDGKTVSNFKVDVEEMGGLFGNVQSATIKNLKVQTANIKSTHFAGGIAAHGVCAKITDCAVEDVTITVDPTVKDANDEYNGDKAGGIIGYLSHENGDTYVKNCTATKVTIQAYRDFAGIVGYANGPSEVSGSSVENIVLTIDNTNNYKNYSTQDEYDAGAIVGEAVSSAIVNNDTPAEDTYEIIYTAAQDYPGYYKDANGKYIVTEGRGISNAVKDGATSVTVNAEIKATEIKAEGKTVTIKGEGENASIDFTETTTKIECTGNLIFEDLAIKMNCSNYANTGLNNNGGKHEYKNCDFYGTATVWGECTYTDCTFTATTDGQYAAFAQSFEKVTYNGCTFTASNRAAKICPIKRNNEPSTATLNVTYSGCTFNAEKEQNKSAVEIDNNGFIVNVTFSGETTLEGFIKEDDYFASEGSGTTKVNLNGFTWKGGNLWMNQEETEYVAISPDALVAIFNAIEAGDEIRLVKDLDMTGKTIDATNGNVGFTLYGDKKTISNLKGTESGLFVNNTGSAKYYFYNVKLQDCSVESSTNYGALFVGDADTCEELIIEGCEVNGCTVKSAKYAAAFVGYTAGYNVQNNGPVYSNVTIKDCKVVGGSITGGGSTAAAIGHSGGNPDTTNKIENLNVSGVAINGEDTEHTGIVVGTANVGKTFITNATYDNVTGNYNTEHPLFGRCVPGTTGVLTIDDLTYVSEGVWKDAEGNYIVKNGNELNATIKVAEANSTIKLLAGTYEGVEMAGKIASDLTIQGTEDAIVKGIKCNMKSFTTGANLNNLTFDNVRFQDKGVYFVDVTGNPWGKVDGLTMNECTMIGTGTKEDKIGNRLFDSGGDSTGSHQWFNIKIEGCTISNTFQGIRLGGLDGNIEVSGNIISNIGHNAITLRNVAAEGIVLVEGNEISNGSDRAFRIGVNSGSVTYKNNKIVNCGDLDDGSNFKANTLGTVTFEGNTVNGQAWNPLVD